MTSTLVKIPARLENEARIWDQRWRKDFPLVKDENGNIILKDSQSLYFPIEHFGVFVSRTEDQ